jgi:DNA mismatch endonuclease (patch repair protein)
MARLRNKNTKPERFVRSLVHSLGYRFRLHRAGLPGRPDLVFPSRRAVVFVHGCFFHRHQDQRCRLARLPKSRLEFWLPKLDGNRRRDKRNERALKKAGWRVLTLWECQLANKIQVIRRVVKFLGPARKTLPS